MRTPGQPDCFQVVNGPEDGAEFPMVRSPIHMGHDPRCAICISLDASVVEDHALVSAVSDGYRIRRLSRAPVFVNGKRAGMIRSRVVCDGGTVQVGRTLLALECAPDGLACRSRGIVTESDSYWAARHVGGHLVRMGRSLLSTAAYFAGRILSSWWGMLGVLALLYLFVPGFRVFAQRLVYTAYWYVLGQFLGVRG